MSASIRAAAPPGRALRQSLRRGCSSSPDGIFLVEGGRIRIGNRFLSEWGGYRGEEIDGTCFASFFRPAEPGGDRSAVRTPNRSQRGRPTEFRPSSSARTVDRFAVGLKAEGCRFDGRSCVLVDRGTAGADVPQRRGWDSDVEGYFVSEDALRALRLAPEPSPRSLRPHGLQRGFERALDGERQFRRPAPGAPRPPPAPIVRPLRPLR